MNEQTIRVRTAIDQLIATIENPWESLPWALGQHPFHTMGDPDDTGSAAWHLMHMAQVFRIHAKAVMGTDEIERWPAPDPGLESAAQMLRDDVQRFAIWCNTHPDRCDNVHHGEDMSFDEMIGVMLRHIVWHAAAVHYWCLWKGAASNDA